MDTTRLPAGIIFSSINFVPWKARMNAALQALGLPTGDARKPDTTSDEEWTASSEFAANMIRSFVSTTVLRKVSVDHYYDAAKLMLELESLTLRFRFMDLPPEVRIRTYRHLMSEDDLVDFAPLKKKVTGYPLRTYCVQHDLERVQAHRLPTLHLRAGPRGAG